MRRLLPAIAIVAVGAASAWGVWCAWPRRVERDPGASFTDLDHWERLSQQYQRPLPTGKDLVLLRTPLTVQPRQLTYSVTANGWAP